MTRTWTPLCRPPTSSTWTAARPHASWRSTSAPCLCQSASLAGRAAVGGLLAPTQHAWQLARSSQPQTADAEACCSAGCTAQPAGCRHPAAACTGSGAPEHHHPDCMRRPPEQCMAVTRAAFDASRNLAEQEAAAAARRNRMVSEGCDVSKHPLLKVMTGLRDWGSRVTGCTGQPHGAQGPRQGSRVWGLRGAMASEGCDVPGHTRCSR